MKNIHKRVTLTPSPHSNETCFQKKKSSQKKQKIARKFQQNSPQLAKNIPKITNNRFWQSFLAWKKQRQYYNVIPHPFGSP